MDTMDTRRLVGDTWRRVTTLTPWSLVAATLIFVAADRLYQGAGDSFIPGGPLDETAHFLTMLFILWVLGSRFWGPRVMIPALIATVAIDADHIPGYLGVNWLTAGTPRPYTHSLLTIILIATAALLWRRHRVVLLAVVLGVAVHLWRDMAESSSGVSLLWPVSRHPYTLSHSSYLAVMAVIIAAAAVRCLRER